MQPTIFIVVFSLIFASVVKSTKTVEWKLYFDTSVFYAGQDVYIAIRVNDRALAYQIKTNSENLRLTEISRYHKIQLTDYALESVGVNGRDFLLKIKSGRVFSDFWKNMPAGTSKWKVILDYYYSKWHSPFWSYQTLGEAYLTMDADYWGKPARTVDVEAMNAYFKTKLDEMRQQGQVPTIDNAMDIEKIYDEMILRVNIF